MSAYALGFSCFGQKKISGWIFDLNDGQPLIGAHVLLQSNWKTGTTSDQDGFFSLELIEFTPADSVIITYVGYREQVIPMDQISEGSEIFLEIKPNEMGAISVIEERLIAEEFSVKKINRLEVYKNPSAKADALLAVNATPSSTTIDESANVSFRGSSPVETGIFFNNVPIYDAVRFAQLNGIGTFSFFNTDLVKSIQVFPGNPPLEFGNTSSGLIAIQSDDRIPEVNTSSVIISLANIGINHRHRVGKRSALIAYSNFQPSTGIKSLNKKALEDLEQFGSVDGGLHFTSSHGLTTIKIFNYFLKEQYKYRFRSPTFTGLFDQSKIKNFTTANIIRKLGNGQLSFNNGFSFTDLDFSFSRAVYDIRNEDFYTSLNYGVETVHTGLKIGLAYDGRFQRFDGRVPGVGYAIGEDHPFEEITDKSDRQLLDAFVYFKYIPVEEVVAGLAIRKNMPLKKQSDFLSWQVNTDFELTEAQRLKFAFGKFNNYRLSQDGSTQLLSTTQFSVDHQFEKSNWLINTSFFSKKTVLPSGKKKIVGIESYWKYAFTDKLFIDISYTGLDARIRADGLTYRSVYDLNYFIRGGMEFQFGNQWTISSRYLFRQGIHFQPVISSQFDSLLGAYRPIYASQQDQQRYPGYNLVDLNVSKLMALGDRVGAVLFASASNVADFKNVRTYEYNFDYTDHTPSYFNRRTYYFGCVLTF